MNAEADDAKITAWVSVPAPDTTAHRTPWLLSGLDIGWWCGPSALSITTGEPYRECTRTLRKARPEKGIVRGVDDERMIQAVRALVPEVVIGQMEHTAGEGRPNEGLDWWLKRHAGTEDPHVYIITANSARMEWSQRTT